MGSCSSPDYPFFAIKYINLLQTSFLASRVLPYLGFGIEVDLLDRCSDQKLRGTANSDHFALSLSIPYFLNQPAIFI
jgi:hypothetical protein